MYRAQDEGSIPRLLSLFPFAPGVLLLPRGRFFAYAPPGTAIDTKGRIRLVSFGG